MIRVFAWNDDSNGSLSLLNSNSRALGSKLRCPKNPSFFRPRRRFPSFAERQPVRRPKRLRPEQHLLSPSKSGSSGVAVSDDEETVGSMASLRSTIKTKLSFRAAQRRGVRRRFPQTIRTGRQLPLYY